MTRPAEMVDPPPERAGPSGQPHRRLGQLLRAHRLRSGLTQQQLADLSTVSARAIGGIERGSVGRPRRETMRLLVEALRLADAQRAELEALLRAPVPDPALDWFAGAGEPGGLGGPIPMPLDRTVGREPEITLLREMLVSGDQRLAVVTGLPGVGKTRVAAAVASRVRDRDRIPVQWRAATSSVEHAVGERPALLVVDGLDSTGDHLDGLVALLRRHGELRVLVTTREPVDSGGVGFPLPPLPVPPAGAELTPAVLDTSPAVRLLVRHARWVRPSFCLTSDNRAAVGTLCRLVDGIPAALAELGAWLLVSEPSAVLKDVLDDPLGTLDRAPVSEAPGDLSGRLRQTIRSLDPDERSMLARLAELERGWAPHEVADLTGVPVPEAARLFRRSYLRGLVRAVDQASGSLFVVLQLARRLLRASLR